MDRFTDSDDGFLLFGSVIFMGYAVVDSNGVYAGAWSSWMNPPRELLAGESVIECEWDVKLKQPIGLTVLVSVRSVPAYDFQFRFTDEELVAIQLSTDPTTIRIRTMLQTMRDDVDLDSEDTQRMVGYLAAQGFLTKQRAADVLS